MKHIKYFVFYILITVISVSQTACDWNLDDKSDNIFVKELQGTWFTNDYFHSKYYGCLEINQNNITISGYGEDQTEIWDDENQRPFKDFLKNLAIEGYSVEETKTSKRIEGQLFIQDGGKFPDKGIPYEYWTTTITSPNYQTNHFLRFYFGGKSEILVKEQNE
jgi:hypothetical protein